MEKEQLQEQLAEKYKRMGIPMPIPQNEIYESSLAISKSGSGSMLSKIEQIRRGAKKNDFQNIIARTEPGAVVNRNVHQDIPVSRPSQRGNNPNVKRVAVETPAPVTALSEALEAERIMFGGSSTAPVAPQVTPYGVHPVVEENYGPQIDYKAKLEKKLGIELPVHNHQPQQATQPQEGLSNVFLNKKLNELENRMQDMAMDVAEQIAVKIVNEMTSEIATEVARKVSIETTKKIILEFGKAGKQILVESNKVKRAEVVDKDKVRIDGKIYKLTEVKA